jgi:hypothetical protein
MVIHEEGGIEEFHAEVLYLAHKKSLRVGRPSHMRIGYTIARSKHQNDHHLALELEHSGCYIFLVLSPAHEEHMSEWCCMSRTSCSVAEKQGSWLRIVAVQLLQFVATRAI